MNDIVADVKLGVPKKYTGQEFREAIINFEDKFLSKIPGAMYGKELDKPGACPLKHTFIDGIYVREIFMPKGTLLTSKIHKTNHPYFVMEGDVSVATEQGIIRIKAPYQGITAAGTKRLLYMHEDTVWATVHATNKTDPEEVEEDIIAKSYEEFDKLLEVEKCHLPLGLE